MNGTPANACPSHFALDDRDVHGADAPEVAQHIEGCRRCATRRAERAAERQIFDAQAAALWTRIAAAGQERRARRGRWAGAGLRLPALVFLGGLGALAVLIVGRGSDPRRSTYVAPKGRAPVEIICRRGGAVFALAPGDDVAPGDELRFRPLPVWPDGRFIQIGSVDGTGRYTPFYPAAAGAPSVPLPAAAAALDGSIRLDSAPGPERLFVVISAAPLSETAVAQIAEARVQSGVIDAPADRIGDAPVHGAWIVLHKRPGGLSTP
jgi:hypothetical protein